MKIRLVLVDICEKIKIVLYRKIHRCSENCIWTSFAQMIVMGILFLAERSWRSCWWWLQISFQLLILVLTCWDPFSESNFIGDLRLFFYRSCPSLANKTQQVNLPMSSFHIGRLTPPCRITLPMWNNLRGKRIGPFSRMCQYQNIYPVIAY